MAKKSVCAIQKFVERDIDMLMAEELRVNNAFAEWAIFRAGHGEQLSFPAFETRVSVVEDGSEADVVASFRKPNGGIHRLFIENKIEANMMPDQLERYIRRAEGEERRSIIESWSVIFFTPSHYSLSLVPDGVVQISFEEAAAALRRRSEGLRSEYRADLLEQAAPNRKPAERDAHVAAVEPYIAEWWDGVYAMLGREFPGFFLTPGTRYPRSVYFAPRTAGMPSYLRVDFKGHKGEVDLAFKNIPFEDLAETVSGIENLPGRTVSNGKSSAIQIHSLAPFRIADGTEIIETRVRAAYQAAYDLLIFWRNHRERFDHLASRAVNNRRLHE